jgi:Mg-chelatase subunit ChlD
MGNKVARLLVALVVLVPMAPVESVSAVTCTDVHIVWARGANLAPNDFDWNQFVNTDLKARIGPEVSVSDYQLGNPGFGGFTYQPGDEVALIVEGLTAPLPFGPYDNSVQTGINELSAYMTDRVAQCANEVYVLGGYSEGADVTGRALSVLPQSIRDRVVFVALFGDPILDTGNWRPPGTPPVGGFLPSCFFGRKPWVRGSAPCWSTGGIFGSHTPYVPSDMEQRVGSWCRDQDAACVGSLFDVPASFNPPTNAHYRYFDDDSDSAFAAQEAAERLATYIPAHASSFDVSWDQFIFGQTGADLAIVFDTTGSMSGAIANAKTQATDLAETWLSFFQNGRVGLAEFRDQGDLFVSRVDLALTNDPAAFQTAVNALAAAGGGDTPEAQLSGIMTALDGMSWADGATKAVVVITDAVGKDPEPITGFTRAQVSQHALEIDPVAIYGVNVSSSATVANWMTPMADVTAGEVFTLAPGQSLSDALFDVLEAAHANPVAKLDGPYIAETGTAINFSAANSFPASAPIVSYEWDFDLDGTIDRTTATPTTTYTYAGEYHGMASVEVIADDDRSAIATTEVTVDSVGLADLQPIAPVSAMATATGPNQATVSWTPAADDRADGYKIYLADGTPVRFSLATDPDSVVIDDLDLSQPVEFWVVASNRYGDSTGAATGPVGGGDGWSSTATVNDVLGSIQLTPAVVLGPDGAAHAVWRDGRPGSNGYEIYYSRRDPLTGTWGPNERVNNVTTGNQDEPAIAVDSANNVYVVWNDRRLSNDADTYFSKRSAASGTWTASVRVNDDGAGKRQDFPSIAITPTGDAIAVWRDQRGGGTKYNIFASRLPAGSSTWTTNRVVTDNASAAKQQAEVAVGPDGVAYAAWHDERSGNSDIWFSSLPAGGTTWAANAKISDDPGSAAQTMPDLGVDSSGNLTVVWEDGRSSPTQIRARRRPAGGSWGASVVVAAADSHEPTVAIRTDGRGYAVWHNGPFLVGSSQTVWGADYDATAGSWSTPEQISDLGSGTAAGRASVALDATQLIVVFDGGPLTSQTYDADIRARRKGL